MPCLRLLLGLCLLTIGITTPCRALAEQPLPMNPASLPRDTALPSLATHASADQQYALYLPPDYSPAEQPERRWPVLIILDPRGRALESLRLAVDGARRHDWVVLSSYQSRSDTQEEITLEAIRALLDEAQNYIAFDPRRLYFAGMSPEPSTPSPRYTTPRLAQSSPQSPKVQRTIYRTSSLTYQRSQPVLC